MSVSFTSAFEKTIGQVIKPDVINPELQKYLENGSESTQGGIGPIKSPVSVLNNSSHVDNYDFTVPVTRSDASLIEDGMLMAPKNATYEPGNEAMQWSWGAAKDFLGLKGFVLGLAQSDMSIEDPLAPQLARSGEATNVARDFADMNIGGALGATEAQRRFLPTSSGSIYDRVNPLKNSMPSWLPGDNSEFWINFSTGDPFTKVEHGEFRLPGVGYESIHEELKGYNPEDYPDIYKFKILSDVAMGSDKYYAAKNLIQDRENSNSLTGHEQGILATIREQEAERSIKKRFSEYKTDKDLEGVGIIGKAANAYWEGISHNAELPTEYMTFFRPGGKLVHQRTAIEDYQTTQITGSDLALWDKPIDHFIKPTLNAARGTFDDDFIPEEVQERRNIDEYFDRLEYLKYRRLYKESSRQGDGAAANNYKAKYQKTTHGAVSSNVDNEQELMNSYIGLSAREKPYFTSFIAAEGEDRDVISSMLPKNMSALYQTIWSKRDAIAEGLSNGVSPDESLRRQSIQDDAALIDSNQKEYGDYKNGSNYDSSFREYLADKDAESYMEGTTGVPDDNFVGWDPRIDLDSVKLRALKVGDEDMHDYGFWDTDQERLSRLMAVMKEEQVTNQLDAIKNGIMDREKAKAEMVQTLTDNGFDVKNVDVVKTRSTNVILNVEKENV